MLKLRSLIVLLFLSACGGEENVSKANITMMTLLNQNALLNAGQLTITPYSIDEQQQYRSSVFDLASGRGELAENLEIGQWKYYYTGIDSLGNTFYGESATIDVGEKQGIGLRGIVGQSNCIGDALGDIPASEAAQAVSLLSNGKLLLTGGGLIEPSSGSLNGISKQIFIYDPNLGSNIKAQFELQEPRAYHTATLMDNGLVLVAGGVTITAVNGVPAIGLSSSAEIIDVANNTSVLIPNVLIEPRFRHTATTLSDGSVLIVGGMGGSYASPNPLATTIRYYPSTNQFIPQGNLKYPRAFHSTNVLAKRTTELAIVTGGLGTLSAGAPLTALDRTELFVLNCGTEATPPNGCFIDGGEAIKLGNPRWGHSAVTLDTYGVQIVLIVGGFSAGTEREPKSPVTAIEAIQVLPGLQRFATSLILPNPRGLMGSAAVFDRTAGQSAIFVGGRNEIQASNEVLKIIPAPDAMGKLSFVIDPSTCPLPEFRYDIPAVSFKSGAYFIGGIVRGQVSNVLTHLVSKRISIFYPSIIEADLDAISKQQYLSTP
jgi:hypothetical protein